MKIIVFANEKGGAGKSTLAIHCTAALLASGKSAAVLDLDLRQTTLKNFFMNRAQFAKVRGLDLANVTHIDLGVDIDQANNADLKSTFLSKIREPRETSDFLIIDCPGSLTRLSHLAHQVADTLVTPLNDSFVDFDLLGKVDPETMKVLRPSIYSEMVWQARQARAKASRPAIDWIVTRNRLSPLYMHNKRKVGDALKSLSQRIGFRIAPGLSDRVIYRELFPQGLTLLDNKQVDLIPSKLSNVAARQELRDLVNDLRLDGVKLGF